MSNTDRPEDSVPAPQTAPSEVTIRRAPKFGVFIVGGAVLGLIAAFVVTLATMDIDRSGGTATTGTTGTDVGFWGLVGYFSLWGGSIGMIVGAIVAIILDRVFTRRAALLTAERIDVAPPTETIEGEIDDSPDAGRDAL